MAGRETGTLMATATAMTATDAGMAVMGARRVDGPLVGMGMVPALVASGVAVGVAGMAPAGRKVRAKGPLVAMGMAPAPEMQAKASQATATTRTRRRRRSWSHRKGCR